MIKTASGINGHQQTQTDTPRHLWTMSGWKTHNFFHLALLGYQNIKMSIKNLHKNGWVLPKCFFFMSVIEIIKYSCSWSPCIWRARSIARRICGSALKCWFGEEIQMKLLLCCAFQCWWIGKLFKSRARWRLEDQWLWLKLFAKCDIDD